MLAPEPMEHNLDPLVHAAEAAVPAALAELCAYLRVPAISCDPAHADDVRALAAKVAADLRTLGFEDAEARELDGALPCVTASWIRRPGAPTVLVYGHLDLQPTKGETWTSPPHAPEVRDGRLYARGAADDMGGWVSHLAAIRVWLAETGSLPCNLRLVIEGEEEIGSPNLERYIDAFPECFAADAMVLTDCENPSPEIPGLTVSLRGLLELTLRCSALEADIHSGLWGGMVPDVSLALMRLVSRLIDEDGRVRAPRSVVPEAWRQAAWDVPLGNEVIAAGAHLRPDVDPLPHRGAPPAEHLWRQPAVTVVATTLPTRDMKKNALRRSAEAVLSVRVAPGMADADLKAAFEAELRRDPPAGVHVELQWSALPSGAWLYQPRGPAFEAVDRAYTRAWGRPPLRVGIGGSIPFVALFGRRFGDLPLILNGVIDPQTTAHGPDESLHLDVFRKAVVANVCLYAELADVLQG